MRSPVSASASPMARTHRDIPTAPRTKSCCTWRWTPPSTSSRPRRDESGSLSAQLSRAQERASSAKATIDAVIAEQLRLTNALATAQCAAADAVAQRRRLLTTLAAAERNAAKATEEQCRLANALATAECVIADGIADENDPAECPEADASEARQHIAQLIAEFQLRTPL